MQLGFFRAGTLELTTEHAQSKTSEEERQMQELNCPTHPSQRQARSVFTESNRTGHEPVQSRLADRFNQSPCHPASISNK